MFREIAFTAKLTDCPASRRSIAGWAVRSGRATSSRRTPARASVSADATAEVGGSL
jgi:hypothetical protein